MDIHSPLATNHNHAESGEELRNKADDDLAREADGREMSDKAADAKGVLVKVETVEKAKVRKAIGLLPNKHYD